MSFETGLSFTEEDACLLAEALHHWRTTAKGVDAASHQRAGQLIGLIVRSCLPRIAAEAQLDEAYLSKDQ